MLHKALPKLFKDFGPKKNAGCHGDVKGTKEIF